jgi:hypothetical protein
VNPGRLFSVPFESAAPSLAADLQVPRILSARLRLLAERVTAGASGPWQAALDLKRYLDTHEHYSYDFQPGRRDPIDQFLFVTHSGYCDQFSTAFIMMARLLGIPARWVVGYGPGTETGPDTYVLRGIDAHSWTQIHLTGYGWVAVDPTPTFASTAELQLTAAHVAPPTHTGTPRPPKFPKGGSTPPAHPKGGSRPHPKSRPTNGTAWSWALAAAAALAALAVGRWALRRASKTRGPGRHLAAEWAALLREAAPGQSREGISLRDEWRLLPPETAQAAWPAVELMEAWWYGNSEPDRATLEDAERRLHTARLVAAASRRRTG